MLQSKNSDSYVTHGLTHYVMPDYVLVGIIYAFAYCHS